MLSQLDAHALRNGVIAAILLTAAIFVGSSGMRHFDPALIAYASASIFALFGLVYRYSVWLQRPPTRLYWRRGWQLFLRPASLPGNLLWLIRLFLHSFVLQTFIEKRSHLRWIAHFLISWGCILAALVTFPLVFGWVHFDPAPHDPTAYRAFFFGIHAGTFPATSVIGWMVFHLLDYSAIAIIIGMGFALRRRLYDRGAMTTQQFGMDFLPLILLFSVCVTGLMLTASSMWMRGHSYSFLALLHAFSVIVTLLYLPFGKFFHIFQRPANLGVQFYKKEGRETEQARCKRCAEEYASRMHVEDLKRVLDELGLNQTMEDGTHYQEVCPVCRRKLSAVNQLDAIGGPGFL